MHECMREKKFETTSLGDQVTRTSDCGGNRHRKMTVIDLGERRAWSAPRFAQKVFSLFFSAAGSFQHCNGSMEVLK